MVIPHLPIDIRTLAADVREVEDDPVPPAGLRSSGFGLDQPVTERSFLDFFARAQLHCIHAADHSLPFALQVRDVVRRLRVFLEERVAVVVARRQHVGGAVVLGDAAREAEVAVADQEDALVGVERDVGFLLRSRRFALRLLLRRLFGGRSFCVGGRCGGFLLLLRRLLLVLRLFVRRLLRVASSGSLRARARRAGEAVGAALFEPGLGFPAGHFVCERPGVTAVRRNWKVKKR